MDFQIFLRWQPGVGLGWRFGCPFIARFGHSKEPIQPTRQPLDEICSKDSYMRGFNGFLSSKHQAHQTPHNSSRSHPVCMRNVKWMLWPYSTILIITHEAMLILDNSKMAGQLWFTSRSGMNQASLKPVSALWVEVNSHLGLVHFSSPSLANRAIETGLQLV